MHYITITCDAKLVPFLITNITFKPCNALQCIVIIFSITPSLVRLMNGKRKKNVFWCHPFYRKWKRSLKCISSTFRVAEKVSLCQCQLGVESGFHPTSQSYVATVNIFKDCLPAWGWSCLWISSGSRTCTAF